MRTVFSVVVALTQYLVTANSVNPPHGCTNFGYCYPEDQITNSNGEIGCSDCVCPEGTSKVSATECDAPATCAEMTCPSDGEWECSLVSNAPKCNCVTGWAPPSCTIASSSPCSTIPCLNRGECSVAGSSYQCDCQSGTYGEQCQYDGDLCASKCQNGGICEITDRQRTAICKCPVGYVGADCETAQDATATYVKCFSHPNYGFASPNYYLHSTGSANNGPSCRDLLQTYLKSNPESTYRYSTYYHKNRQCYFSTTNELVTEYTPSGLLTGLLDFLLTDCKSGSSLQAEMQPVYFIQTACEMNDPCTANGVCYNTGATNTGCVCYAEFTDSTCSSPASITPCSSKTCGTGACEVTDDTTGAFCRCLDGRVSTDSCGDDVCATSPCQNGGTCLATAAGFECECLNLYTGTTCTIFNACYENQCLNGGNCTNVPDGLESTFSCECPIDFTGERCETQIFACDLPICENGGTCEDGPSLTYTCFCTDAFTGVNCTIDVDECALFPTICNSKDPQATCVNTYGSFECVCGDTWLGSGCNINRIIFEILNSTHGNVQPEDLDRLTDELMGDPTVVRDIIPFLIGGYPLEERMDLSWDYDDIFIWVAYEEKLIDVRSDFIRWNDKVLGNCFTFNHLNSSTLYKARGSGIIGGLELQTNVQVSEYLPWIETAAIMVFTHNWDESIFAESPRINCRPNNLIQMNVQPVYYERLGGRFGRCVKDVKEVKSYYYGGTYTTDGCLRSCYQDAIKEACGCMDPRYPAPESESSCSLAERLCIEETSTLRGDPSKWKECICPLPCFNTIYNVAFSESIYVSKKVVCESKSGISQAECYKEEEDKVLLRTTLPTLVVFGFVETEAFGVTSFLSRLGGLLGILMGISAICLIEFIFLLSQLFMIFISNTKFTSPLSKNKATSRKETVLAANDTLKPTAKRSISSGF